MLETPQVEVMLQSNDNPEVTITVQVHQEFEIKQGSNLCVTSGLQYNNIIKHAHGMAGFPGLGGGGE